jgi:hypothetical protein
LKTKVFDLIKQKEEEIERLKNEISQEKEEEIERLKNEISQAKEEKKEDDEPRKSLADLK